MDSIIVNVFNAALCVYLMFLFFRSFTELKFGKCISAIGVVIASIVFFFMLMTAHLFALKLLLLTIATVGLSFLFEMKWYNHILLSLTVYALIGISEFMTSAIMSAIFNIGLEQSVSGKYFILGVFLSKLFAFLIITVVKVAKHNLLRTPYRKQLISVICVPIATFSVFFIQYYDYVEGYEINRDISIFSAICYFLLIASNMVVFSVVDNICDNVDKDVQISAANKLIEMQQEQYREMILHNEEVFKLKHERKNFLLGLLYDLANENYLSVSKSVEEDYNALQNIPAISKSNNIIYNIIEYKRFQVIRKDIIIEYIGSDVPVLNVPSVDVAIILGNAIDNAIEACVKQCDSYEKTINVSVSLHNDKIVMLVENPVSENVDVKNIRSTKNSSEHGFGILNMKSVAQKYGGEIMFSCDNNWFQTHILLKNIT